MTLIKKSIPYQDSKKYHSTNEAVQLDPSLSHSNFLYTMQTCVAIKP